MLPLRALPFLAALFAYSVSADIAFEDASSLISGFANQSDTTDGFSGVVWFDYDRDGDEDLFVTGARGYRNGLLRNDGGSFIDVTVASRLDDPGGGGGAVAVDVDNDGYQDLIIAIDGAWFGLVPSRLRLFRNRGDGTFANRSLGSGLDLIPGEAGQAQHLAAADIDNDGLVDLFVTAPGNVEHDVQPQSQLFRNNGAFTFSNITDAAGVGTALGACAAGFTDHNRDGWQDLIVADCHDIFGAFTPIELFLNNGDLTFTPAMQSAGLDTRTQTGPPSPGARGFWMCVGLGDYDNDLDFDLFSTNAGTTSDPTQEHGLFENLGDGTFTPVETEAGIALASPQFGWGCGFADFDNDGWLDLSLVGSFPRLGFIGAVRGNPGQVLRNNGDSTFSPVAMPVDLSSRYTSGLGLADFDADGRVDIAIGTGPYLGDPVAEPVLLHNVSDQPGHWLQVRLAGNGTTGNADAIGARVWVLANGTVQTREVRAGSSFLSQHSLTLHFGLGAATTVQRVFVKWPSGGFAVRSNVPADGLLTISQ